MNAVEGANPLWQKSVSGFDNDNVRSVAHDAKLQSDLPNPIDLWCSESSGDSILIGVEDNPEFDGYQPQEKKVNLKRKAPDPPTQPSQNFPHNMPELSEDEDEDEDEDDVIPHQSDDNPMNGNTDSNFTFGNKWSDQI